MDNDHVHVPGIVIPVIECDLSSQKLQGLIGRNLLDQGFLSMTAAAER